MEEHGVEPIADPCNGLVPILQPHIFCVRTGRIPPPSETVALSGSSKGFQTGYQTQLRISTALHKTFDKPPWQIVSGHRRHQTSR